MIDGLTLPNCAKGTATCTAAAGLRIHEPAGLLTPVIGSLLYGARVDVWSVVDGWARVQTASGLTGWASMTYLKVQGALTP